MVDGELLGSELVPTLGLLVGILVGVYEAYALGIIERIALGSSLDP